MSAVRTGDPPPRRIALSLALGVPDAAVTADAGRIARRMPRRHHRDDGAVAAPAVLLDDRSVEGLDLDRIGEIPEREVKRVPEAVPGLRGHLADGIVGRVAVVAGRGRVVRGAHPAVVLLAHDVAVRAGVGIVGEVGAAMGIGEGVEPRAHRHADGEAGEHGRNVTNRPRAAAAAARRQGASGARWRGMSCDGCDLCGTTRPLVCPVPGRSIEGRGARGNAVGRRATT